MEQLVQVGMELLANPALATMVLGLIVFVILAVKDFNGVVMPLVRESIERAEAFLKTQAGEEKLRAAVDFVMDFLPLPYRILVPRAMVVALVQAVFNRDFARYFAHDKAAKSIPLPQPTDEPPSL